MYATRVPGVMPFTSGATASTTPAASMPGNIREHRLDQVLAAEKERVAKINRDHVGS